MMSTLEWILIVGFGAIVFCLFGIGMAIDKVYEALQIREELKKFADRISRPPG